MAGLYEVYTGTTAPFTMKMDLFGNSPQYSLLSRRDL